MKPGDIVRSHFRAGWYGEVLCVTKRKDTSPLVEVRTICGSDGRLHRRSYHKEIDAAWLTVEQHHPVLRNYRGGSL